jgi:hypothetical protein
MPSKSPLPQWIPPQLTQLVETAPSGPHWLHEIKLDGFRMAARIKRGEAKLLTRTGLDWSAKYPSALSVLASVRAGTAYLDENCAASETTAFRASPTPRQRPMGRSCEAASIEQRRTTRVDALPETGGKPNANCRGIRITPHVEPNRFW